MDTLILKFHHGKVISKKVVFLGRFFSLMHETTIMILTIALSQLVVVNYMKLHPRIVLFLLMLHLM